jgi:anhydro-N-acetylmuramic acid kinase
MIVAGVMSGTSADGIDVAFISIENQTGNTGKGKGRDSRVVGQECPTHIDFLGHAEFPYPAKVRKMVLASMNSAKAGVADLARLNFLLGELYADAVLAAQKKLRLRCDLIGCHGQTLYHQGTAARFLGRQLAVTWQTGEGAVIAARTGTPVISDFRPADIAAGGKGAPLVPYLDYLLYRDARVGRIALNIGGIANLTAVPANASITEVFAFDTGPGNMVMDALAEQLFGESCDKGGKIAASGKVHEDVVGRFLRHGFFRERPPKTAGREEFGRECVRKFLGEFTHPSKGARGGAASARGRAAIATATALTARSIQYAIRRFVLPKGEFSEIIVSGGGTKNRTLMTWLSSEMTGLGLRLRSSDEFGVPSEAKEAVAFAVLAFETWNRRPSNVPSATGAKRAAVLGKISYP